MIDLLEKGNLLMIGVAFMLYPVFTYEDGTEVTSSKPDENGFISLYIEKFDINRDAFTNASIVVPNATVKSSSGYSKEQLDEMIEEYSAIRYDIIGYVTEKVKNDA